MAFTINTNIASLQAQNYLRVNSDFQSKTINRVTSGLRIVSSGDDAAGLAIANGYRSDEAVLAQGVRNANDGLSQLQIADGGISNISQLLDRARTLATQSSSGALTGSRDVLNSEFQSLVTEIDRQAQSIGLNQGGLFAKNLNVFIGGGKDSAGVNALQNGTVAIDLSQSTVDSSSLGLKGVQASGVAGTDIGPGSATTSLSAILANVVNTNSVAASGFTDFEIKGPGFDGIGVKVAVNTANLGNASDLVAAINAAIGSAANGGTQQATAFKNAGVVAAVNTDATGKTQLVFKSSTTAFQVEAGDRVANALLGNFEQNAISTGTDSNAFVDTSGANHTLTFAVDGGSTFSVSTITSAAGTSKGQIAADLNASVAFSAVATAYVVDGNQLVIKSKNTGANSSVAVTSSAGTLSTTLGFTGTATAGLASTGADLNVRVQGASVVAAGSNVIGTNSAATLTLLATNNVLYLTNGASGAQTLTLNTGTSLTKADIAADINTKIAANGNFTGANVANNVTASVVNNQIVLTANVPGTILTVSGGANNINAALGFTAGASSTNTVATTDSIKLRFQGSGLTTPVDIALNATTAGTTTTAQVLSDLQTKIAGSTALSGAGITLTTSSAGDNLVFTSSKGEQFQVIATGDSRNILGLGSFKTGAVGAVDYNTITAGSAYSTSAPSGTANLEVSLNGLKSSTNAITADLTAGDATAAAQTGTVVYTGGVVVLTGNVAGLDLKIDGGTLINVVLGASATTTIASILTAINTAFTGAAASAHSANAKATLDGSGNLVITSGTKGANSSVEVISVAGGTDTVVQTALGFNVAGSVGNGLNATEGNVVQQLNASIATKTALVSAGLQAQDNGSGSIQLVSANSTFFRVNAAGPADIGFGNLGATFTGNAQGAAPATPQLFDAQGSDASATLAYNDTLYGSDKQTITVTANDAGGAKHSLGVTLHNDATARNQTIDQALSTINAALQQSNDSTLNRIVAVKEDVAGAQAIRFLSTVKGFQVSVDSTPGTTGITPPTGNLTTSTAVGSGANSDISNIATAQAAVAALSTSIVLLGKAQAVVGRGQNQFNYAINLAQSQVTNLAAAESRIRDADLAAESANLTKSQILLQAGIAALAQANSAPQQVLALLK